EKLLSKENGKDPYSIMTEDMDANSVPGSNGIIFLPFLQGAAGARTNPNAKGTFLGMSLGTTKADMARAVLEGICFEMYDIVRAEEAAGINAKTIRLTGGASKSPFWCQMLADIMQKPVQLLQTSETGCLGAALYAGIGSGIYKDAHDAVNRAVKITREFTPDPSKAEAYQKAFERWCEAYEALEKFYK
ncbi:MAG: FGGY-family carbohydrate kinase, partial [Christensenellales bacterium]